MSASKGRETLYKGIKMRSRLEADFAGFLDRSGVEWDYEKPCFAGPGGQWLPDFRLPGAEVPVYFEIKPRSLLDDEDFDVDAILERMSVAWLTDPVAILQLTFWTWGKPEESYSFFGIPPVDEGALTWWCGDGVTPDKVTGWVGMGQLLRMCEKVKREREVAGDALMTLSEICRDEQGLTALVSGGDAITACGITPEGVWWCECGTKVDGAERYVGPGDVCGHLRIVGNAPTKVSEEAS